MSTDAGATWTDMTGDVGGESMHPDQHALAFVPGNPSQFFVGSDGGVIRTSGEWADASCAVRQPRPDRSAQPDRLPDVAEARSRPSCDVMNAGLPTLQMNQISVNPFSPTAMPSRARRTTARSPTAARRTWYLPLTGDGGDSGFDAVDRNIHFHMYTGGQIDVNYNGNDPASWLWIGDKLERHEHRVVPVLRAGDRRPDRRRRRSSSAASTSGGRRTSAATGRSSSSTATRLPTSSGRATSSTRATAGFTDWFPLGGPTLTSAPAFGGTRERRQRRRGQRAARTTTRCGPRRRSAACSSRRTSTPPTRRR